MQPKKSKVLGFAGQIASGKSTISKLVAEKLKWKWVGFGDFLSAEARRRGLDASQRSVKQNLGQEFIRKGWPQFCLQVLESANWKPGQNFVVDGIRHVGALETLQKITQPSEMKLVYIATQEEERVHRAAIRGRDEDLPAESHPVESEVRALLPQRADLLVDNSLSESESVMRITEALGPWLTGS